MTDKSKKQVKHEKHSHEKKHHGHEKVSKKQLGKVHGGNKFHGGNIGGNGGDRIIDSGSVEEHGLLGHHGPV